MIETTEALDEAVRAAIEAGAVGIDTEFIWERTYYPTLGIVQIGFPDGRCELVDAPKVADWSPLRCLLEDAATVKILHDAQQDLVILNRVCGGFPKNIFDSQRASGFVGLASTISLSDLLKRLLKIRLAKTETRSDWLARPLSEEQVKYAEDDVRYSVQLMDSIMKRAAQLGRREWIEEEMRAYENESLYGESDPDLEMPRVRGSGSLTRQQRDILRALGAWRERKARKRNLPRHFVLSDDAIISLTRKPPERPEAMRPVKGLSEKQLQRYREALWKAVQRGLSGDMPELPNGRFKGAAPDEGFEARVDLALAFVKGVCLEATLDPALIGNRAEITALVLEADAATPERHRILRGWRRHFCGESLLDILRGERALRIAPESKLPALAD